MQCKILKIDGQSAVISSGCDAYIVDVRFIGSAQVGEEVYIDVSALSTATYYGIDWSVICPDGLIITPEAIQQAMCRHGIVSVEDVLRNASMLSSILASEMNRFGAELYTKFRLQLGG